MKKAKDIEEEPINFSKSGHNGKSQTKIVVDYEQTPEAQNLGEKKAKKGIPKIVFVVVGIILATAIILTTVLLLKKSS